VKSLWLALTLALSNAPTPVPWQDVHPAGFPQADPWVALPHQDCLQLALDHDRECDAVTGGVPDYYYSGFTELGWFGHRQLIKCFRGWYPAVK
jgi:hypothetical protein